MTFLILNHFPVVFPPFGSPLGVSPLCLPRCTSPFWGRSPRAGLSAIYMHSLSFTLTFVSISRSGRHLTHNPKQFLESSQEGLLKNRRPSNNRISLKNRTVFFCRPGMSLKKYSFLKTSCPELFRLNSQEDPRKAS